MASGKSPTNLVDLTGMKFNRLSVVERSGRNGRGLALWLCSCECGKSVVVQGAKLRSGHTKSCGCIVGKSSETHGLSRTPTYNSWCAMKQRCNYESGNAYKSYGAKGIKVCERWANSFDDFLADMGERPEGMTLDRIDSSGGYEPGNCRWATKKQQDRNRKSNILVTRDGVTKCVKDWCDELGLNVDQVYGRIRWGKTPEEALR